MPDKFYTVLLLLIAVVANMRARIQRVRLLHHAGVDLAGGGGVPRRRVTWIVPHYFRLERLYSGSVVGDFLLKSVHVIAR